jgi:hypothetical protein
VKRFTLRTFHRITNPGTRRIYKTSIHVFMCFTSIARPEEFRIVTRAHVIAWRDDIERRSFDGATRGNRLAALSCCSARKLPLDEPREGARVFLSGESPFLALFDPAAILVPARER